MCGAKLQDDVKRITKLHTLKADLGALVDATASLTEAGLSLDMQIADVEGSFPTHGTKLRQETNAQKQGQHHVTIELQKIILRPKKKKKE